MRNSTQVLSEERKRQTDGKGRGVLLFLSLLSFSFSLPFYFGVLRSFLSCLNLLVSEQRRRRFLRGTSPLRNLASPSTHHIISFWFFFLFISFLFLLRIVLNSLRPIFLFRRDGWRDNTRPQKKKSWKIIFRLRFLRISFSFLVCVVIFPAFNGNRLCPCSLCLVCVHINIGKKRILFYQGKFERKMGGVLWSATKDTNNTFFQ